MEVKSDNELLNHDDTVRLVPYNSKNKLLTEADIKKIFKLAGLKLSPYSLSYYQKAFVHRSYINKVVSNMTDIPVCPENCLPLFLDSNERLEFLGDSIVGSIVVSYLFRRFPDGDEGFMTKLKTRLVKTDALAEFASYLNLGKHMVISKHVDDKCDGRENPRMLEDLFESFMGAMFLDFSSVDTTESKKMGLLYGPGYSMCESFMINIIEKRVDFENLVLNDENYKDILLRYFQHKFSITPKYIELNKDGPAHKRHFTMGVYDNNGTIIGSGSEKSKKKAEQLASKMALISLGVLEDVIN